VVTTKANNIGEMHTEEEKSLPCILTKKVYASGGGEKGNSEVEEWNGKEVRKKITNPPLKVDKAFVKAKLVEKVFGSSNCSLLKYGEENTSLRREWSLSSI
jgi:hypothetical protein